MEKKIGCYICTGCGIGEALDVKALGNIAAKEQKIPVVKNHEFLCGPEGINLIRNDMTAEGVNALVIVGCSHRVKTEEFRLGVAQMDRVDIRDKCLWVLDVPEGDKTAKEDRQMMASDYVRIGCVKVKKMNDPKPFEAPTPFSKDVLVVGGGIAGLSAALEVAQTGYNVLLVEKEETLGGKVAKMHKVSPSRAPYNKLEENPLPKLLAEVKGNKHIKILNNTIVQKTVGAPGLFDVTLKNGSGTSVERVGSIIIATGYRAYDPAKLEKRLGYGSSPDVITSMEFEEMAKAGKIVRKSDGKPAKRVAFSLCAGQRDSSHLEYCSGACCVYSLKQALYVIENQPDASAYLIYQEVRTPGQMEDFYRKVQNEGGIFIKGDVKQVSQGGTGLTLDVDDKILRKEIKMDVDLLVLATGMETTVDTTDPNSASPVGSQVDELPGSILNLQYRQGPGLPSLKNNFPDSHFICFPYETRRTGIYVAGPARRPMGIAASRTDAAGAALKAIQVVESVARGAAVHPRAGDLSFPSFREEGCTQCKRCTEECPFGAINEDQKGNPLFNPTRCRRCGTCMGACPQKIISFANYSVDMIGSMLKEMEIPEADEEKPRILVFACENDAIPAIDMVGRSRLGALSPFVRIIPLRCMGSMSLVWIADAMAKGYDGVLLMGCRHGTDYQCHNVRGSALAEIRLSKVSETLDRLQLESSRVKMVEVNIMDAETLPQVINDFVAEISKLDPNPYKEF
ncbi:MAG: methyl-viologen-reducing hydrogenase delta subunit [Magnetococcales bacterium]|nr:methyl-viologen-reducing hydrogenase delta subunit [Magnetococcales bacterium]